MTYKILLVDDDPTAHVLFKAMLKHYDNVSLIHVQNSRDGMIKALNDMPDLMILDMYLPSPGKSGLEMIADIKQTPELQHVPIIAISAGASTVLEDALRLGVTMTLQKPFAVQAMRQAIESLLPAVSAHA